MVHLARLARLDDEPDLQARALAHEVMVHRATASSEGIGARSRPDPAVGEDEDLRRRRAPPDGLGADALERALHPAAPSATGHACRACAR